MNTLKHYTKPELAIIEVASTPIMAGSITPEGNSVNVYSIESSEDVDFD